MSYGKSKEELQEQLRNQWVEGKPYVFVSYASLDWEKVYPTVIELRERGFNIYIDAELQEVATRNWMDNVRERIFDGEIRGIISFLSLNYMRSYACMLELLLNQSNDMKDDRGESLPVIYVSLQKEIGSPQSINSYIREEKIRSESKGLAVKIQDEEKEVLVETLCNCSLREPMSSEAIKRDIDKIKSRHDVAIRMEKYALTNGGSIAIQQFKDVKACADLLESNFTNKKNKDIELEKMFPGKSPVSVDCEEETEEGTTKPEESKDKEVKTEEPGTHRITVEAFLDTYNYKNFKATTYASIRLVGEGEYARYTTETFASPSDLVWEFVMSRLKERGEEYIHFVNSRYETKNPVFITAKEHEERKARKDNVFYKKLTVAGLEGYSMNSHYSAYNWVADPLKKRLQELDLPLNQMKFEYTWGSEAAKEDSEGDKDIRPVKKAEMSADKPKVSGEKGRITGPVSLSGNDKKAPAGRVSGEFTLAEFVKKFDGNTFQSSSCDKLQLVGHNGYEHLSLGPCVSARELVITFMLKRLEEQGMKYIETVNASYESKNPLFIPVEEHRDRKSLKSNVQYMEIDAPAGKGYSFNTHYSEYNWLRDSLMKQLRAMGVSPEDLTLLLN